MINPNELRIGNHVKYDGCECYRTITEISKNHIKYTDQMIMPYFDAPNAPKVIGIPLTEEWLIKAGINNGSAFKDNEYYSILQLNSNCQLFGLYFEDEYTSVDIQYVHQLQNLYITLTEEELTIK